MRPAGRPDGAQPVVHGLLKPLLDPGLARADVATGHLDRAAEELGEALEILSSWDEGCDLVLYYKHMMMLQGDREYALHFNPTDELSPSQRGWAETQLSQFKTWYAAWSQLPGAVQACKV